MGLTLDRTEVARAPRYYVWGDGTDTGSAFRVMIADGAVASPGAVRAAVQHGLDKKQLDVYRLYAIEYAPFDEGQLADWLEEPGRGVLGYCRAES